jgi:formate dehydrogenase iron-sulfur subunit
MVNCSAENRLRLQREGEMGIEKSVQIPMPHLNYLSPRRSEIGMYPNARQVTAFHHCNHCENSPCQHICPTGAITTRAGGEVVINQDICIGCQSCGDACPFDVPKYSADNGKAYKCSGCYDRVENDLKQSCVEACPTTAMFSGYKENVIEEASKRAAIYTQKTGKKYVVYGAESLNNYVGTLKWITIVEESDLAAYQLDTKPERTAIQWRDYAKIGGGALAVATVVGTTAHFIYWLDKRKKKIAAGEGDFHE